jgi:hypothetical protein
LQDEDELETSDQTQILAQWKQQRVVIPLSNYHIEALKQGMVKIIKFMYLPIIDHITIPANETMVSQPNTCLTRKL